MIIITIPITPLFTALLSGSDSVFGIRSGIMASSDLVTGDILLITGDTIPIIGEEAITPIMGRHTDEAATPLTVPRTEPISARIN